MCQTENYLSEYFYEQQRNLLTLRRSYGVKDAYLIILCRCNFPDM